MSTAEIDEPVAEAKPIIAPVIVTYCTVCLLPCEYCEFGPAPAKCKEVLLRNNPALFLTMYPDEAVEDTSNQFGALDVKEDAEESGGEDATTSKKKKSRGGKGLVEKIPAQGPDADPVPPPNPPSGKKKKSSEPKVVIKTETKAKKKSVTVVTGLDLFGIDLKKSAKSYASKFACGASVVKNPSNVEEIVIQGDVPDRVSELILKEHGAKITKELISFVVK